MFLDHLRCTVRLNMLQNDRMAQIQDRYQIALIQLDCRFLWLSTPHERDCYLYLVVASLALFNFVETPQII